ncbi:MAG: hypothetical protein JW751_22760 [Polyangiaceae bacterium]|nr:hypothetical protein [Polyangiaceae bacterium]
MTLERIRRSFERLDAALAEAAGLERPVADDPAVAGAAEAGVDAVTARDLFESIALARHLDRTALELRAEGLGHYTITSAGHEGNVVLGRLTRTTDPTLVHYRSAALVVERSRKVPGIDPVADLLLSLVAARDDPIAGGRHKVFGRRELGIIPQTSTIASHLPRAVGLAYALEHRRRSGLDGDTPPDAIAVASFGDAGVNHSTFLGAANAAGWAVQRGVVLPLLLVCEDNGLGLSVRSPPGWVEARLRALPNVQYVAAEGWDLLATYGAAARAVAFCRVARRPVILHLRCERLLPHAGADMDTVYRKPAELARAEERDPLTTAAAQFARAGLVSAAELGRIAARARERVDRTKIAWCSQPPLGSREEIQRPLATPIGELSASAERAPVERPSVPTGAPAPERSTTCPPTANGEALTLAHGIRAALTEALAEDPRVIVFGEDVGRKGGVHGVTRGLAASFGRTRVFDTLLDEQTILGLALGAATLGLIPVPEIQYLAFLHHASDQLRGEAATLPFFSQGAYQNPMVLRVAGFADPRGTGGHFHNDASLGDLRDVAGLLLAVPARGDDAVELYRAAFELARRSHRVVVVVEPTALYHERDLATPGDGRWLAPPSADIAIPGAARVYHCAHGDLTLASYGPGVRTALAAAETLGAEHGIDARILDLRWLAPLPETDLVVHARATGRLLFVDPGRRTGGVSEAVATVVVERGLAADGVRFVRVTGADCPIPLGPAARHVLPSVEEVVTRSLELVRGAD